MIRDGGDGHDDEGGRGRGRGHRGAWQGCGRCSCCHPEPIVGPTNPKYPNTVYRLSLERARPLVVVNSEPANELIYSIIVR